MSTDELSRLRAEMDAVNQDLLAALQRRAALVCRIGDCKRQRGLPLVDAAREREMLQALLREPGAGFDRDALRRIFTAVFAASRELVQRRQD